EPCDERHLLGPVSGPVPWHVRALVPPQHSAAGAENRGLLPAADEFGVFGHSFPHQMFSASVYVSRSRGMVRVHRANAKRKQQGAYSMMLTVPPPPSTRMRCPVAILRNTSGSPATAGRPNSRATIAPCDSTPPVSITRPFASAKSGTHDGSVDGQTRI